MNTFEDAVAAFETIVERIKQTMEDLDAVAAAIQAMASIPIPRKEHRRPPRYAGPQNKGRSWNRQPPRVARSNCPRRRR